MPHMHKSEEARARCWGCSHPEKLQLVEGDVELLRALYAEGWRVTSNRYRRVKLVRVPELSEAIVFTDKAPQWLRSHIEKQYERIRDWGLHMAPGDERELTPAQFLEFKRVVRTGGGA